jgi:hypothetical protein
VIDFLEKVPDLQKREDCLRLVELMQAATGAAPKMWGDSIVGFGTYHYKSVSGREGDWLRLGFSPRKQNLTLYLMSGFKGLEGLLGKLGKHKLGKGCLYINRLKDVDEGVLKKLLSQADSKLPKD